MRSKIVTVASQIKNRPQCKLMFFLQIFLVFLEENINPHKKHAQYELNELTFQNTAIMSDLVPFDTI